MPCRTACFTAAAERAWQATRIRRAWASPTAAATSSSEYVNRPGGEKSEIVSPSRKILTMSTRFFASERTAARTAQGPSAISFRPSLAGSAPSALLPVEPRSRSDAASRGPGTRPWSIAARSGRSMPWADPKEMADVKPAPSTRRALSTASSIATGSG